MSDTSLPDLNEATSPTPHDSNDPSQPWPTRGSTEGYVRPSLRLAKKKERKPPLHASLAASIEREHAAAELGTIRKTTGLQGSRAEDVYRSTRPVHTSPVTAPPLPPMTRAEKSEDEKQLCQFHPCKLMGHEDHLKKFMHECKYGVLCTRRSDPAHRARYIHRSNEDEDMWAGKTGWEAENHRSPYCLPGIHASVYQKSPPARSSVPRAGFRPNGGVPPSAATELKDERAKIPRKDEVVLLISGIEITWTQEMLDQLLQDNVGNGLIVDAKLLDERGDSSLGRNAGKAMVTLQCYADAQRLKRSLDARLGKAADMALDVVYRDSISKDFDRTLSVGRDGRSVRDPAVSRFNRVLKTCGPYFEDAEAVFERMQDEGHRPDLNTFLALITCYRDAIPAQPGKAQQALDRLRGSGLVPNAAVCNVVVDCWCRAGQMPRAEKLVAAMESGGPKRVVNRAAIQAKDENYLPLPNEETYQVLMDGWERLGLMDEMAERQRGFRMDEEPQEGGKQWAIGGVVGIRQPATTHITSWARRRAGYVSVHSGMMTQKMVEDNHSVYTLQKWRSRT